MKTPKKIKGMCRVTPCRHGLIKQIADETGFSASHISLVLRGERRAGEELAAGLSRRGFKFGRDGMVVRGK